MKSLENKLSYQILTLNLEIMKNNERYRKHIAKYGYVELGKNFSTISKDTKKKLDSIHKGLIEKYKSLELKSENLEEIESVLGLLLYFKKFDETILPKIESKILELTKAKEEYIKSYDFKNANIAREEVRQLQKYYNSKKDYLK